MSYSKAKLVAAYMSAIASIGIDDSIFALPRYSNRSYHEEKQGEELAL